MDGSQKEGLRWALVIILAILTIGVLGGIFWLVFYSNALANSSAIIPLRKTYGETVSKITKSEETTYTIQTQGKTPQGAYTYLFTGTFVRVNTINNTIALKGADERVYSFRIDNSIVLDDNSWLKIYKAKSEAELEYASTPETANATDNIENVLTSHTLTLLSFDNPSTTLGKITVRWRDQRTLSKINSDYSKDPATPVNSTNWQDTILAQIEN